MSELFKLAESLDARLLLSGDRRQHGAVERGAALRLLEEEAGLVPAEVKEIQRQSGNYKAAVKAMSEGRTADGFDRLDELGWVREIAGDERDRRLAADYVAAVRKGETALVISPTHAEGERITAEIRRELRENRKLKSAERTFRVLKNAHLTEAERGDAVNYLPGDVLQFHQNAKGFRRGHRVTVKHLDSLPLEHASRFEAFHSAELSLAAGDVMRITHGGFTADGKHRLNNGSMYRVKRFDEAGNIVLDNGWTVGKDFGHLAYGYVITSHASQSKTVDYTFIGQSSESFPATSREQIYVSASRSRKQVVIYTDDKKALREAITHSDERLSATEFVNGKAKRQAAIIRGQDEQRIRKAREREAQSHGR